MEQSDEPRVPRPADGDAEAPPDGGELPLFDDGNAADEGGDAAHDARVPPVHDDPVAGDPDARALDHYAQQTLAEIPDSLPILEAFQEFLEEERIKARRRMLALSIFFLSVLACVVVGGLLVGAAFFNRVRRDFRVVEEKLTDGTRDAWRKTEFALTRLTDETDQLRSSMSEGQKLMSAAQTNFDWRVSQYDRELGSLREVVRMLETESAVLREGLGAVQSSLRPGSPTRAEAMETLTRLRGEEPARTAGKPRPSSRTRTLLVPVRRPGSDRPVTFRLPIPE